MVANYNGQWSNGVWSGGSSTRGGSGNPPAQASPANSTSYYETRPDGSIVKHDVSYKGNGTYNDSSYLYSGKSVPSGGINVPSGGSTPIELQNATAQLANASSQPIAPSASNAPQAPEIKTTTAISEAQKEEVLKVAKQADYSALLAGLGYTGMYADAYAKLQQMGINADQYVEQGKQSLYSITKQTLNDLENPLTSTERNIKLSNLYDLGFKSVVLKSGDVLNIQASKYAGSGQPNQFPELITPGKKGGLSLELTNIGYIQDNATGAILQTEGISNISSASAPNPNIRPAWGITSVNQLIAPLLEPKDFLNGPYGYTSTNQLIAPLLDKTAPAIKENPFMTLREERIKQVGDTLGAIPLPLPNLAKFNKLTEIGADTLQNKTDALARGSYATNTTEGKIGGLVQEYGGKTGAGLLTTLDVWTKLASNVIGTGIATYELGTDPRFMGASETHNAGAIGSAQGGVLYYVGPEEEAKNRIYMQNLQEGAKEFYGKTITDPGTILTGALVGISALAPEAGGIGKVAEKVALGAIGVSYIQNPRETTAYIAPALLVAKSPVEFEKIEAEVPVAKGKLDLVRESIAKTATEEGGYVGGSSAVVLQLPENSFRTKLGDVDTYFNVKSQAEIEAISSKVLAKAKEAYAQAGLNPENVVIKSLQPDLADVSKVYQQTIYDKSSGVKLADINPSTINLQKNPVETIDINGINAQKYEQIGADKAEIVRILGPKADNLSASNLAKLEKARADIAKIQEAEAIPATQQKALLQSAYISLGEQKVFYLATKSESGFKFGGPDIGEFAKSENLGYLFKDYQVKSNVDNYPKSQFATEVLTDPRVLNKAGAPIIEIAKIDITKDITTSLKDAQGYIPEKFIRKTRILNEAGVESVIKTTRKLGDKVFKVYGSFSDVSQRPPEFAREVNDIEISLKTSSREEAVGIAQQYASDLKGAGIKDVSADTSEHIGVMVGKQKAIEVKFLGEEPSPEGSPSAKPGAGLRVGIEENRKLNTIEGIKTASLGEQNIRKGSASANYFKVKTKSGNEILGFEPAGHRPKDVVDFYAVGKSQLMRASETKTIPASEIARLNARLEQYRSLTWRTEGVAEKFAELDANRAKFNKIDLTESIKGTNAPEPGAQILSISKQASTLSSAKETAQNTNSAKIYPKSDISISPDTFGSSKSIIASSSGLSKSLSSPGNSRGISSASVSPSANVGTFSVGASASVGISNKIYPSLSPGASGGISSPSPYNKPSVSPSPYNGTSQSPSPSLSPSPSVSPSLNTSLSPRPSGSPSPYNGPSKPTTPTSNPPRGRIIYNPSPGSFRITSGDKSFKPGKNKKASFQLTRYSDLLSVMQSQRKYGKATHPSLQRNPQIAHIEPIFGKRVPTVELIRSNKNRKNNKQSGGTLWRAIGRGK